LPLVIFLNILHFSIIVLILFLLHHCYNLFNLMIKQ
jgi:hypothetical protein